MTSRFTPRLEILPRAQRALLPRLAPLRSLGWVLYGGTAIALRLGHRQSIEFDFFHEAPLDRNRLYEVLPVPDAIRKEEVKAYVILRPGLTRAEVPPEAIIAHARKYLAPFKLPRYIEYRSEFPRTPSNKIRKPELLKEKVDLRTDSWDRIDGVWR